jgi:hypothetical protein
VIRKKGSKDSIMKKYTILGSLLALLFCLPTYAQIDCISTNREMDADRIEDLDGRYGLLILSSYNDLVVNSTNTQQKPEVNVKNISDGNYEYQVLFAASDNHRPKVEISHRGSVYSTSLVQLLKPDFLIAYRLIDTPFPIRYDDQTQGNDAILSETDAAVEITTNIEGLEVSVCDELQAKITSSPSIADKNITITTITFAVQRLKDMADRISKTEKEYNTREQRALDNSSTPDSEWEAIDMLKSQLEKLQNELAHMVVVEVYTEQSNKLAISIADMTKPRMKRCYAVLPIVVEKEVFVTECSAYMKEGGRLFARRDYDNAKSAYKNALASNDLVVSMKPTIQDQIAQCDSCIKYEQLAAFSLKRIIAMSGDNSATQLEAAKYAQAGIEFLTVVNNYNPNEFYTQRIEKLQQMMNGFPLVIKFTCVEWRTLSEGDKLDGVEIWTNSGSNEIPSKMTANDKKFRTEIEANPKAYQQVGVTSADGTCEIEFDRKNLPAGLFFRPTGDDKKVIKIKYLSMDDLMKKSSGTFMERQFRLKMYIKQ